MFITFEGVEGSGKSTQSSLLKQAFEKKGKSVLLTREPGGTKIGQEIRNIILHSTLEFKHEYSELLLFYVDRLEHIKCIVEPALKEGKIVLCDRYIDSTIAYQVHARGMSLEVVNQLTTIVGLIPQKTILLDLEVNEGIKRAKKRAELDRFEKEKIDFHQKVRNGYLEQAKHNKERIFKIEAGHKTIDEIHHEIRSVFEL